MTYRVFVTMNGTAYYSKEFIERSEAHALAETFVDAFARFGYDERRTPSEGESVDWTDYFLTEYGDEVYVGVESDELGMYRD